MIAFLLRRWFVPRAKFDQVYQALVIARQLVIRHHDCGRAPLAWGGYCPVCHRENGTEPEFDQIHSALEVRERL